MRVFSTLKLCLATACLAVAAMPAHADDQLARVKKAGELVLGTEMQFAPFDFLKDGKQEGFNKELFAEVGKGLGVKIRFIDLPWPSVLPGLDAKKFDMVAGPLNVTKARMERYTFTLPIADGTVALLKRTSDKALQKPADIAGKAVGGGKGSAQLAQLKEFADTLNPKPQIKEYIDNNQAYADLAAGRIVAVGNSLTNIGRYLLSTACARQFGWIGTQDLLTRLEATLATLTTLQRHRGHFLNWYDTQTRAPLLPM